MKMRLHAAWLLLGLASASASAQSAPPVVGYITAAEQPVYDQQTYTGRIQARQIVQLQARVTGYLTAQDFTDGQEVKAGQLLYVIEQPPYQALVDQAQAAVAQAQAQARNAQLTLSRAQALLHTAAGQQSSVDLAQATALSDQAAIASAEAQLQTAKINYGYTQIRAPMDGVMGATAVNVGNVVGPQSGVLATIVSEDPIYVSFALPSVDALADREKAGQLDLLVQLPDGSMYDQTGRIDFVNNQVTQNTDTLAFRATIANPEHQLTDGEFVTVIVRARAARPQLVLPLSAVVEDQLGDYVLKVGPGNIVLRQAVALGTQTDTNVNVRSGVSPGDKIITQGIQMVHPGLQVNPQPAAAN
jgi:membrane fusion protein (multidrug efflux system)